MREITLLFLICALLGLASSGNSPYEQTIQEYEKRMTFLIRHICQDPNAAVPKPNLLIDNEAADQHDNRKNPTCSDTIGFLTYSKNKVQVFVTANLKVEVKSQPVNVISIELHYTPENHDSSKAEKILTCDSTGSVNPEDSNSFKVEKSEDVIAGVVAGGLMVQCKGVYLEKKDESSKDLDNALKKSTWTLKVNYVLNGNPDKLEYTGALKYNVFNKMRCDPSKLVLLKDDDAQNTVKSISNLFLVANDEEKLFLKTSGTTKPSPLVMTTVDWERSGCPRTKALTYNTVTNPDGSTISNIKCNSKVVQQTAAEEKEHGKKYTSQWEITTCKINQNDCNKDATPVILKDDTTINLECSVLKCRECKHMGPADGPGDAGKVFQLAPIAPPQLNECFKLDVETACIPNNLVLKIDNEYVKMNSAQKNIECVDGKYEINGISGSTYHCSEYFPYAPPVFKWPNSTALDDVKGVEPLQCNNATTGCLCGPSTDTNEQRKLAILKKDGSTWLRVKSIHFNKDEQTYTYVREKKKGERTTHSIDKKRVVSCILSARDARTEAQLAEIAENKSKSMVFIVNVVVLALTLAASIPGVIFYVNARIKKREARKAAKKDKKKEEQSVEKKDSDAKKNEA